LIENKKKANHKPGSVITSDVTSIIYLALTSPLTSIDLPSPQNKSEQLFQLITERGIHGLSARKVYLAHVVTNKPVSSYLTFSPFPKLPFRHAELSFG